MLKADLHVHTEQSFDCRSTFAGIVSRCQELGIGCVAIADHGTAAGGLRLREMAPFKVIVGEEVLTTHGEIMGMFLQETVPSGITPEEAVSRIKAQGGLVCLPHPFDRMRSGLLRRDISPEVLAQVDIIECYNARTALARDETTARRFAAERGLACSAGSDAHSVREIGNAYVEMPDFSGPLDFCAALAKGAITGRRTSRWVHLSTSAGALKRRLLHL